jgi:hypothetical protein
MRSFWLLCSLLFLLQQPGRAQGWEFGLDFSAAFPQGEFADTLDEEGMGGGFWFTYGHRSRPVRFGMDLTLLNYGSTSEDVDCQHCDLEEIHTSSNIGMTHFMVRLQPFSGAFRPYFDTMLGFKHFVTTTTFEDEDWEDYEVEEEKKDTAPSYGVGTGFSITLTPPKSSGVHWNFNLGARYLFGADAEYILADTVEIDGTWVSYQTAESKTNLFTAQVGFSWRF